MGMPVYKTYHLVKGEDLNHHGRLYAGRNAEWFVESGFIAAETSEENELQEQARQVTCETKGKE